MAKGCIIILHEMLLIYWIHWTYNIIYRNRNH